MEEEENEDEEDHDGFCVFCRVRLVS